METPSDKVCSVTGHYYVAKGFRIPLKPWEGGDIAYPIDDVVHCCQEASVSARQVSEVDPSEGVAVVLARVLVKQYSCAARFHKSTTRGNNQKQIR